MSSRLMNHVRALQEEIGVLKDRIQPHDTGHIYTTISTLEERVKEINEELEKNQLDDEDILELDWFRMAMMRNHTHFRD